MIDGNHQPCAIRLRRERYLIRSTRSDGNTKQPEQWGGCFGTSQYEELYNVQHAGSMLIPVLDSYTVLLHALPVDRWLIRCNVCLVAINWSLKGAYSGGNALCLGCALVHVVVVTLTLPYIIKSVVTGQAPVTLECRNTPGKKHQQNHEWYTHIS